MILSDLTILDLLERQELVITPLANPALQVQPASVDLRLGDTFQRFRLPNPALVNRTLYLDQPAGEHMETVQTTPEQPFLLLPGDFALGTTVEEVALPDYLLARVEGRSSLARRGLLVHVTAGFIDPGFRGQITLELGNLSPYTLALSPGMRICQLCIEQLDRPAGRPYGHPSRRSKYQNQQGVTESRLHLD